MSSDKITAIEGNENNVVGRKKVEIGGRCIRGYGVPKYSDYPCWIQSGGVWYYRLSSTKNAVGWNKCLNADGNIRWYYFSDKGAMQTGMIIFREKDIIYANMAALWDHTCGQTIQVNLKIGY